MEDSPSPRSYDPSIPNRKRTSHACDYCRHRKVRCDGRQPCTTCSAAGEECLYGTKALPKSRGDMLLEVTLRSEKLLRELKSDLSKVANLVSSGSSYTAGSPVQSQHVTSPSYSDTSNFRGSSRAENIDNATISTLHTSTTESILRWPYFDDFPSLRSEIRYDVFKMEQARQQPPRESSPQRVFAAPADIDQLLVLFQQNVNVWHPTMHRAKLANIRTQLISHDLHGDTESCLAFLVVALSCATAISISAGSETGAAMNDSTIDRQMRAMMDAYFDEAMTIIQRAFVDMNTDAVQCLFYAALYYAFLQCPLQAWSFLTAAATKCHLLLSYPAGTPSIEDVECVRRIFWSCYILESNYLAELSALPQSGLGDIESSIPLPREFDTHDDPANREQSSFYFLACISMRRLLNRVHHLLYAKDTGATFDDSRFPSIVAELSHQLEEWRELLPPDLQFSVDTQPAANALSGFLRQRYLTCRSVIFRPFLMWALMNCDGDRSIPLGVLDSCEACLEACMLHILNLRSFPHTVMVDTWICSLSMASAMLILLAASRLPMLRPYLASKALLLGPHLEQLFRRWMYIPGSTISPSVEHSLRMIIRVSDIFKGMARGTAMPKTASDDLSRLID